jgi:hypothetical protein
MHDVGEAWEDVVPQEEIPLMMDLFILYPGAISFQVDYALVGAGAVDDGGGDACVALAPHISAALTWNHLVTQWSLECAGHL